MCLRGHHGLIVGGWELAGLRPNILDLPIFIYPIIQPLSTVFGDQCKVGESRLDPLVMVSLNGDCDHRRCKFVSGFKKPLQSQALIQFLVVVYSILGDGSPLIGCRSVEEVVGTILFDCCGRKNTSIKKGIENRFQVFQVSFESTPFVAFAMDELPLRGGAWQKRPSGVFSAMVAPQGGSCWP